MNTPILTEEEVWRRYDASESRLTAAVSERMLDLSGLGEGGRLLDLATGRGEPALRAARRVGPHGRIVGIDVSEALLQMAREKIEREHVAPIELRAMDAEQMRDVPSGAFDAVTVRWGLQYMRTPLAALKGARRALAPHGKLVAALWAEPERVSYFTLPRRILQRFRSIPAIDFTTPGTFAYADPARIVRDFTAAGFAIAHIEEMEVPVIEATTSAQLIAWVRALGLTRLLNELPKDKQDAWEEQLIAETASLRKDGLIHLGGVTRLVVATPTPTPNARGAKVTA